jgi:hypothetical protein
MTVEVLWDNDEKTVLRYIIAAPWTWDEFWTAFKIGHQLIDSVNYSVDHIVEADYTLRSVPPGMLTQLRAIYRSLHPRRGKTALLAHKHSAVRTIWFRMALVVYPSAGEEFIFVDTLEEAREVLAKHRIEGMQ